MISSSVTVIRIQVVGDLYRRVGLALANSLLEMDDGGKISVSMCHGSWKDMLDAYLTIAQEVDFKDTK